jgi:streptogramin lyase
VPVELMGDSVAVIDPATDTIVGEIPVGGRPAGPAVGEGSVWLGNRDDNTLLRIDPRSLDVVRTIGLRVAPTDVEVGTGNVWVLSDWALLRVDPATNDVVDTIRLPRASGQQRWSHMEVGGNAVYVCSCVPIPSRGLVRIDPVTRDIAYVREGPVGQIAYGENALWALTGYEADTIERIDPESNAVVATISLERVGELHGYRPRIAVGEGAIWVAFRQSLWRIDPATNRFVGSVPVGIEAEGSFAVGKAEGSVATGYGALWIMGFGDGVLRRVNPVSQTVAETIPLGTLIYPADLDAIAVGEGSVWVAVTSFAS